MEVFFFCPGEGEVFMKEAVRKQAIYVVLAITGWIDTNDHALHVL